MDWNEEIIESLLYIIRFRVRLFTPDQKKKIVSSGLNVLMQCLSGSQVIVELTMDVLQILLNDFSSCEICLDYNGINLVASARAQISDKTVQHKGAILIGRLKQVQNKRAIEEINKISDAIAIDIPLNALHAVSIEKENINAINDGVDTLLLSLSKCLEEEEVQVQSVDAILLLAMKNKLTSFHNTTKEEIISLLVRTMKVHPKSEKLQWRACLTISVLRKHKDLVHMLNQIGAQHIVLNILREFSGSGARNLIQQALWALASLLRYGTNNISGVEHISVLREADLGGVVTPLILTDIIQLLYLDSGDGKDNVAGNDAQSPAKIRFQKADKTLCRSVDELYQCGDSGLIDC